MDQSAVGHYKVGDRVRFPPRVEQAIGVPGVRGTIASVNVALDLLVIDLDPCTLGSRSYPGYHSYPTGVKGLPFRPEDVQPLTVVERLADLGRTAM